MSILRNFYPPFVLEKLENAQVNLDEHGNLFNKTYDDIYYQRDRGILESISVYVDQSHLLHDMQVKIWYGQYEKNSFVCDQFNEFAYVQKHLVTGLQTLNRDQKKETSRANSNLAEFANLSTILSEQVKSDTSVNEQVDKTSPSQIELQLNKLSSLHWHRILSYVLLHTLQQDTSILDKWVSKHQNLAKFINGKFDFYHHINDIQIPYLEKVTLIDLIVWEELIPYPEKCKELIANTEYLSTEAKNNLCYELSILLDEIAFHSEKPADSIQIIQQLCQFAPQFALYIKQAITPKNLLTWNNLPKPGCDYTTHHTFEVGFGSGLNFILSNLSILAFRDLRAKFAMLSPEEFEEVINDLYANVHANVFACKAIKIADQVAEGQAQTTWIKDNILYVDERWWMQTMAQSTNFKLRPQEFQALREYTESPKGIENLRTSFERFMQFMQSFPDVVNPYFYELHASCKETFLTQYVSTEKHPLDPEIYHSLYNLNLDIDANGKTTYSTDSLGGKIIQYVPMLQSLAFKAITRLDLIHQKLHLGFVTEGIAKDPSLYQSQELNLEKALEIERLGMSPFLSEVLSNLAACYINNLTKQNAPDLDQNLIYVSRLHEIVNAITTAGAPKFNTARCFSFGQDILQINYGNIFNTAINNLHNFASKFNTVYLDGFDPAKNNELWNEELYRFLSHICAPGARLATYASTSKIKKELGQYWNILAVSGKYKRENVIGWWLEPSKFIYDSIAEHIIRFNDPDTARLNNNQVHDNLSPAADPLAAVNRGLKDFHANLRVSHRFFDNSTSFNKEERQNVIACGFVKDYSSKKPILVHGAGIAGLATARYLENLTVCNRLLNKDSPNRASRNLLGLCYPQLTYNDNKLNYLQLQGFETAQFTYSKFINRCYKDTDFTQFIKPCVVDFSASEAPSTINPIFSNYAVTDQELLNTYESKVEISYQLQGYTVQVYDVINKLRSQLNVVDPQDPSITGNIASIYATGAQSIIDFGLDQVAIYPVAGRITLIKLDDFIKQIADSIHQALTEKLGQAEANTFDYNGFNLEVRKFFANHPAFCGESYYCCRTLEPTTQAPVSKPDTYLVFGATHNRNEYITQQDSVTDHRFNLRSLLELVGQLAPNLGECLKLLNRESLIDELLKLQVADPELSAGTRVAMRDHFPISGSLDFSQSLTNGLINDFKRIEYANRGKIYNKNLAPEVNLEKTSEFEENLREKTAKLLHLAPQLNRNYLLTGLGSRGLTTAPILAQHTVHRILGLVSPLPDALALHVLPTREWIKRLKA